jgi:N-acetylmuramoyl-L-alanine amidase
VRSLALLAVLAAVGAEPVVTPPAPAAVVIRTSRGESSVPVAQHEGHAALPVSGLARLLPVTSEIIDDWALVAFAGEPFRFLLGAPIMVHRDRVVPLVGGAYEVGDSLFVPLQWLAEYVPRVFSEGYRYDPRAARFEEVRLASVAAAPPPPPPTSASQPTPSTIRVPPPSARGRDAGFRMGHRVVVDAGHGGVDPGTPGRYLPRGVQEKHVNLGIALALRDELERRGVDVLMTRTRDTLIALKDRAAMCNQHCDLLVSIHVNSLPRSNRNDRIRGVQTYFLGEALTAEARRVEQMENDALRYETDRGAEPDDELSFIFKDLQTNEMLRESAALADIVQSHAGAVHPGGDRGVSQMSTWVVLKTATRPTILVETGFATNREDAAFLASSNGQRQIARAIANGIVEYLKRYERQVLSDVNP